MILMRLVLLSVVVSAALSAGCSTSCVVTVPDVPIASDQFLNGVEPLPVYGYTDSGGDYHSFRGVVQAVAPDSLVFSTARRGSTFGPASERVLRLSLADVSSLKFKSSASLPGGKPKRR